MGNVGLASSYEAAALLLAFLRSRHAHQAHLRTLLLRRTLESRLPAHLTPRSS